jgi:glycoprotein endo-alpha-1,2-mannosidase
VLYLTRILVGDVAGALADVRDMWRERGHDPYVIADDIFWNVTVDGGPPAFTNQPQASRIRLFDAITAYNPYESERTSHAGHGATSRFVPDVLGLYERYRDATGGSVPIVPNVLSGYNDRGVRPSLDHYVIPRAWAPGAPEGSFLAELLRQVADPWFDPRAPLVFVTSWNEWNEDTGIEPIRAAPATAADTATDGVSRTQGHAYEGFGTRYLEVLRDHYVAVAGSAPPGALVTAWRGGEVVAQDTADSYGRFTLPRAHIGASPVTVVAERHGRAVTPDPARTVLVDL